MEKELEKHLNVLNSERCWKKPKDASVVIDKIIECFSQKQSQFSVGLLIGMILDDNAIFLFIWKMSTVAETVPSVTAAFKLLNFLVNSFEKCTQPYFPILFEKSLHLMNTNFAKIKEEALKLVRNLIVADSKNCLELSKLLVKLEKCLEEAKVPGTVAEQAFGLLGYIFEKYPEIVNNKEWFYQKISESLRKDLTVLKVPSLSRQKGAFEAINGYLVNFTLQDADYERIYRYIKKAVPFQSERRAAGRAALQIVQNHWKYFSERVHADTFFWKKNMEIWMRQNPDDRDYAFGVLHALFSVIALYVKQCKDPVDAIVKEFCDVLESDSDYYEKISALIAFKLFTLKDCLDEDFEGVYNVVVNFVHKHENSYSYLPSCIECVSALVLKTGVQELSCLERLSVKLINNYPKFEYNTNALTALEKSFYMIGLSDLETLQGHIGRVLHQGLLITCSAMTQREHNILEESGSTPEAYTYKSYLSLWKYILDLTNSPNLPIGGSVGLKKGVAVKVFDAFVHSFLRIISKLNYTMNGPDVDNVSDVRIFINCVDLYEDVIQENDHVQKWANTVLLEAIKLSYKNPLVAGFYKIVTKTLRIADCQSDFLDKFLEEVLLKVDLYKGELQLACLRTILASPAHLIQRHLGKVIPAIEVALKIGRGCCSLLKDVIEGLERWNQQLSPDAMETLMQKILPHFDIFFQSQHFRGNDLVDSSIVGKKLKNKLVFNDSELLTLQKKFLIFLGQLDVNKSVHLIQLPDTERDISDKRLMYYIPLINGRTEVDLDELLPRVIDLAVSCSDRDTRVAACELLYSIIMIVLGNINQLSGGYGSVFRKIVKTSVPLACDSDEIICQIYEPLMYQMMHYFSSKKALNFTETNDLIDILMDYVTKPYDTAVRDFSAVLLREFMEWTIKQYTTQELKITPEAIKKILTKIYSLALHPSCNKRQGAAIVFNKIYTVLREEEFILSNYWFELFYYFMESLRMCDGPEDIREITDAIMHIKRPIVEKCKEFNDPGSRTTPPEFNGPRLRDLVRWTAERCGEAKTHTRRIAMSIVVELAPLVDGCDKVADIYPEKPDLQVTVIKFNPSREEYADWLKSQTCLFEYVAWLVENDVLTSEEVCRAKLVAVKNFAETVVVPQGIESESVIAFLNLLFTLRERAFYFPNNFWDVIRVCLFEPSRFGFDLNRSFAAEQLSEILTKLISHLLNKLPVYCCSDFFNNLEPVIIAPVFRHIIKTRQIETTAAEFLYSLKIVKSANFWETFSTRFPFKGITKAIFKSLFHKQGQNVYAVTLEPTCKNYFEELLKLFLNGEDISDCFNDEAEVIEEESRKIIRKGLHFWLTFKESLYGSLNARLLIETKEKGFGMLLDAIESSKEIAKDVLTSWDYVSAELASKEKLLRIALAVGIGINAPGCLKSTSVAGIVADVEKSQYGAVHKLLPYLSEVEEENNDALGVCLRKIEKSTDFIFSLLQSLKRTGSLIVLQFMLSNVAWFKDSKMEDIESALEGFNALSVTHCLNALRLARSFCLDDIPSNASISNIHKLFFQPMMKIFKNEAVYEIVVDSLGSLGDILSTPWNDDDLNSAKPNIMRKICAANMLHIFVTKLTREELNVMPLERRQLIDATVKRAFWLLRQPPPHKVLIGRYRKLMCEMFNMICAVISARCVDEKFYKLFIFDERGSFLFKAIDGNAVYTLGMEFDEIPKRKLHASILRCDSVLPRKYAQTDTLFTSSLREDVTQFDLTYASVGRQTSQMIELEMDTLNSHECMPVLVATVSKMVRDVPHPPDKIPCWLNFFMYLLNSNLFSNNHKLFALKAMYNVQEYLKPYSGKVFPCVLDRISLFDHYPVNYFLIDVIEMMLKWEANALEARSRGQLTELAIMLIGKSESSRRDIIKNNLNVFRAMIETWKDNLHLEGLSSAVCQRLRIASSEESGVAARFNSCAFINLQAAGILLANDIPAWGPNGEKEFFKILLSNFREENKSEELYAEICGMALSYLERKNENVNEYVDAVRSKVEKQSLVWLNLLYNVHKHYPRIVNSFIFKIFSSAWGATDSLISNKLEMLLSHASEPEIDCTFLRHADGFLIDMLNSVDAEIQAIALQIVFRMLDKFTEDRFVLKEALRLQKSVHPGVRKWVYEIAKKMFRKYPHQCRVVLLRGLSECGESKQSCLDFWKSMEITDPVELFKLMYTPETEDIFLTNTARILLHYGGGQYETYVFQNPIIEGRYQKRKLLRGTLHMHTNQSVEFTATARNIQYLRPSAPLSFQPTVQESSQSVAGTHAAPQNPHKKRFKKRYVKFAKRENAVQKRELNTYGEYADGDYPDIKIRHEQMLRLLEVLSERDHHIARLLLVSLYNGMVSQDASDFFEEVLKTSTSFHPATIGFVLQVVYKRGLNIDCELISNAAISSNWLSLGALIIEDSIKNSDVDESSTKKRRGVETLEESRWLELAKLYRNLEEYDVLTGIFLDKLTVCKDARLAFQAEASLDYQTASNHYEIILRSDPESHRNEFYTESYFTCLAKLSNWSSLNLCVRSTIDDVEDLWKSYNLLSWFLRSEMMVTLGSDKTDFKTVMDGFCQNKGKLGVLGANFGEELAVYDWLSGKLQKACCRIDRLCLEFLVSWSHIDQWAYNLRLSKLGNLQTLSELSHSVRSLAGEDMQPHWESVPSLDDDLSIWDVRLAYRREFLKHREDLTAIGVKANLAMAKAALEQDNLILTKEYLTRARPDLAPESKPEYDYYFNLGRILLAKRKMVDVKVGLEMYANIFRGLSKQTQADVGTSSNVIIYNFLVLGQLIAEVTAVFKRNGIDPVLARCLLGELQGDGDVIEALKKQGLEYLEMAKTVAEELGAPDHSSSDIYGRLVNYLLKADAEPEKLARYILKAMSLGNKEARELFGVVLQKKLPFAESESRQVPSWMFITWINQILAALNSNLFPPLKTIILRIANDYPNAIRFAYRQTAKSKNPKIKLLVSRLGEILSDGLYDDFLISLSYLAPPDVILRRYLEDALQRSPQSVLSDLYKVMFAPEGKKFRGDVFKYWDAFKGSLESAMQETNEVALKKKILVILNRLRKPPPKRLSLESYSPWLHNFHSLKTSGALELPGQYGNSRPVSNPITITSFRSDILTFGTKCRPIRITVLGNDAKEHRYLIKFGEDLRQDERVQQLFGHFNHRLGQYKQTKRHGINTYKIIPLNDRQGMIQWVDNHVSLYDVMRNSLEDPNQIAKSQNVHLEQIPATSGIQAHLIAYGTIKRETAVTNFNARVHDFPADLIKRSFLKLSTSPEQFAYLRGNFATSHAVMSITHWLIGIGDRHLQNTLVSTKTGRVLGIDFGYAFGFATHLTPPELVPFRLTPQILNLMGPLNESGWIKQTMVHSLRVFRKEPSGLRAIMEVFIREPVIDWLKEARKSGRCKADEEWNPRERIAMVERKLTGANPVAVVEVDLRLGHSENAYLEKFVEVLKGVEQENVRARLGADGLSEEEQVECLIDLATDAHVLGKTYVGWNPWL